MKNFSYSEICSELVDVSSLRTNVAVKTLGQIDEFYDILTYNKAVDFREADQEIILKPHGLSKGSGIKYESTTYFVEHLLGCGTVNIR